MNSNYIVHFSIPVVVREVEGLEHGSDTERRDWVRNVATENLKTFRWDHKNANGCIVNITREPDLS